MGTLLYRLLKDHGLVKRGSFRGVSGTAVDVYFDLREPLAYPAVRRELRWALEALAPPCFDCVATTGVPGQSIAQLLSDAYQVPLCLVSAPKDHGVSTPFPLYRPSPGDAAWVVDDVLHTGTTLARITQALTPADVQIVQYTTVLDRSLARPRGAESRHPADELPLPVLSLFRDTQFL